MTDQSVVSDPIIVGPQDPPPVLTGTAIVATPTAVAPLTSDDGTSLIVQVTSGNQNTQFANAASWTHNADNSLDIYDANGNLVASFMQGQASLIQLVPVPPPPVTPSA